MPVVIDHDIRPIENFEFQRAETSKTGVKTFSLQITDGVEISETSKTGVKTFSLKSKGPIANLYSLALYGRNYNLDLK
jgi:hypothetical protein